ncbi:hypothetical protein FNF27_04450 [Cafeteria roenbergensis]|uniref:RING-Gid-type domain-containing protein n=1 Tax=Cafeteria roenbergensis TaxID=33653 RepID=A0A5A8EA29_CAFRO|nr:hypothetical protein FNF27_04450 [Cafeteria roenbergensis]
MPDPDIDRELRVLRHRFKSAVSENLRRSAALIRAAAGRSAVADGSARAAHEAAASGSSGRASLSSSSSSSSSSSAVPLSRRSGGIGDGRIESDGSAAAGGAAASAASGARGSTGDGACKATWCGGLAGVGAWRASHQSLHAAVSRASRSVLRLRDEQGAVSFLCPAEHTDTARAQRPAIARCLSDHYAKEGRLDLAAKIAEEAGVAPPSDADRAALEAIFAASDAVRRGELAGAVQWATDHSAFLRAVGSSLELDLHALRVAGMLTGRPIVAPGWGSESAQPAAAGDASDSREQVLARQKLALAYIRATVPALLAAAGWDPAKRSRDAPSAWACRTAAACRRLCAAVAFAGPGMASSPYADVIHGDRAAEAAVRLERAQLLATGRDPDSELTRVLEAADLAIPGLRKLAQVVTAAEGGSLASASGASIVSPGVEVPVLVSLPARLQPHSVFVCPVTRQQCGRSNPPVLLSCGHVVSSSAVASLASRSGRFACPICLTATSRDAGMVLEVSF